MKQDIEGWRRRRNGRFPLGLVLAGTGVALIVLRVAIPQLFGWPAFLTDLFELVGAAMILTGVVLAGWAVWKR